MTGVIEILAEEFLNVDAVKVHICLIEIHGCRLGVVPHVSYTLYIIVFLADIIQEPIALIAVPLMREGIVVTLVENEDTLVVHQFGESLHGLPLSRLLPCDATLAYGAVESGFHHAVGTVVGCLGIAHIVERVSHLVSHSLTYRPTGVRTEPQGRHHIVVATAIASPLRSVVHENHRLVFLQI